MGNHKLPVRVSYMKVDKNESISELNNSNTQSGSDVIPV